MSYEGYTQYLCEVGHLTNCDAYDFNSKQCFCGKPFVWSLNVDQTNDSGYPYDAFEADVKAKTETCPTCHHVKEVEPVRYKIPTEEQMRLFEQRREEFYNTIYGNL